MRVAGWPEKLAEAIAAANARPFQYGTQDCGLFAADVLLAITGTDYAAELRGYSKRAEAEAIVADYGGMESMITALLGTEPVHPARAMRGDVVVATLEEGDTIGICLGAHCAFPQPRGLRFHSRSIARLAWLVL